MQKDLEVSFRIAPSGPWLVTTGELQARLADKARNMMAIIPGSLTLEDRCSFCERSVFSKVWNEQIGKTY